MRPLGLDDATRVGRKPGAIAASRGSERKGES